MLHAAFINMASTWILSNSKIWENEVTFLISTCTFRNFEIILFNIRHCGEYRFWHFTVEYLKGNCKVNVSWKIDFEVPHINLTSSIELFLASNQLIRFFSLWGHFALENLQGFFLVRDSELCQWASMYPSPIWDGTPGSVLKCVLCCISVCIYTLHCNCNNINATENAQMKNDQSNFGKN